MIAVTCKDMTVSLGRCVECPCLSDRAERQSVTGAARAGDRAVLARCPGHPARCRVDRPALPPGARAAHQVPQFRLGSGSGGGVRNAGGALKSTARVKPAETRTPGDGVM